MKRLIFSLLASSITLVSSTLVTDINGFAYKSPLVGKTVNLTDALVTAKGSEGFYIAGAAANDTRVSSGLLVFTTSATVLSKVAVGDIITLTGLVAEFRPSADPDFLTLTELESPTNIVVVSTNNPVTPIVLGRDRSPPTENFSALDVGPDGFLSVPNNQSQIDTVNATLLPESFGMDFWESLNGQLVTVLRPVAINFPNSFGEIWAIGDWPVTGQNSRGGLTIILGPDGIPDGQPETVIIGEPLDGTDNPEVAIGMVLSDITGVVTYQFGFYYILPLTAPAIVSSPSFDIAPTSLVSAPGDLCNITVGSYNVDNMSPQGTHIDDIANHIATVLRSPDIVFIQEVQDNDGPTDDGVVSASLTLSTLIAAIKAAGGQAYESVNIDPVDKADGGQPGGNIRQVYLYQPERLSLVNGTAGTALEAVEVIGTDGSPALSLNPGRIDPTNAAWQDSRKPLVAQWTTLSGDTLFTINLHLTAKDGSTTIQGNARPPVNLGVAQRTSQVGAVAAFASEIFAKDADANIVAAGDWNEFLQARSVFASLTPLLSDLDAVAGISPVESYTYVFDNTAEELDHVFLSPAMAARGAEAEHIHVNNWAPSFAARVSDHDPTVARVRVC
ncbi:DNase I-like protein [Roridomyces roridus]|uniref:DNase I-like protein n=1 Tax=Roridomyces roridus TaxID=1738132 RepID=A0AAD7CB23_9AGAR|nr:DNase I-like protein [Roridomyces roridus]